jgi:tRNA(adenine34) deaminase
MNPNISETDKEYLGLCINAAEETFKKYGNYPVGALLVIDNEFIEASGNSISTQKSFVHHAENQLIINNATKLYKAYEEGKSISLYSTLEPCLQCLGASVTNHINKIVYIQKDPNGGACDLKHDNIGLFYKDKWPKIIHANISTRPLELMTEFFHAEIKKGNIKWPTKMLSLLEK